MSLRAVSNVRFDYAPEVNTLVMAPLLCTVTSAHSRSAKQLERLFVDVPCLKAAASEALGCKSLKSG